MMEYVAHRVVSWLFQMPNTVEGVPACLGLLERCRPRRKDENEVNRMLW